MKAKWITIPGIVFMLSTAAGWAGAGNNSQTTPHSSSTQDQLGTQQGVRHVQCSKLIGSEIKSAQGETLGKVEDLIINPQTGEVRMAIVGTSFAGGQGEMFTPVPWKALNVKSEKDYVLNIDKQKMSSAPNMLKGQYSQLENPGYVVHVYEFYGLENPQAAGGTGQGQVGQQQGTSSQQQH